MSVHTGTHVDSPYHFHETGPDIASVPLRHYIGPARVLRLPGRQRLIDAAYLGTQDWRGVERVLFKTDASNQPEEKFTRDYACLTEDGAEFLGLRHVLLAGTDAPSVDAFDSRILPCHNVLLRHGVAILEGARLAAVPPGDYELICLPLRFAGLDGSPVRAILRSLDLHA